MITSYNLEYFLLLLYRVIFKSGDLEGLPQHVLEWWQTYQFYTTFATLVLLSIIIYSYMRLSQVKHEEEEAHEARAHAYARKEKRGMFERWQNIVSHINSTSPNDWKQAIIAADIMLDDALTEKGHAEETLGEKLKVIRSHELPSINLAWEAHKLRNRIAHEPNLELSHQEARRTLGYFQQVFQDLGVV